MAQGRPLVEVEAFTTKDLMTMYKISRRKIWKDCKAGRLRATKLGTASQSSVRFLRKDVDRWLGIAPDQKTMAANDR